MKRRWSRLQGDTPESTGATAVKLFLLLRILTLRYVLHAYGIEIHTYLRKNLYIFIYIIAADIHA